MLNNILSLSGQGAGDALSGSANGLETQSGNSAISLFNKDLAAVFEQRIQQLDGAQSRLTADTPLAANADLATQLQDLKALLAELKAQIEGKNLPAGGSALPALSGLAAQAGNPLNTLLTNIRQSLDALATQMGAEGEALQGLEGLLATLGNLIDEVGAGRGGNRTLADIDSSALVDLPAGQSPSQLQAIDAKEAALRNEQLGELPELSPGALVAAITSIVERMQRVEAQARLNAGATASGASQTALFADSQAGANAIAGVLTAQLEANGVGNGNNAIATALAANPDAKSAAAFQSGLQADVAAWVMSNGRDGGAASAGIDLSALSGASSAAGKFDWLNLGVSDAVVKEALAAGQSSQSLTSAAQRAATSTANTAANNSFAQTLSTQAFNTQLELPLGNAQWGSQVLQRVAWLNGHGITAAEIQLNPPELGPMQVRVDQRQDSATVVFTSHHAATRDALEASLPRLRELFSEQGMDLLDVDINSGEEQTGANESDSDNAEGGLPSDSDTSAPLLADGEQSLASQGDAAETIVASSATTQITLSYGLVDTFA